MSTIAFSGSLGLCKGDYVSIPVLLSRWARLWRVIRYMRHNTPPEPRRSFCITAVSSSTSFEIAPTAAEDVA